MTDPGESSVPAEGLEGLHVHVFGLTVAVEDDGFDGVHRTRGNR